MKELIINNSTEIESAVFNNTALEKLTVSNSNLPIPKEIGKLTSLKELRLVNNTIASLPVELLDLEGTFVFLENNKPAAIQQVSLLLFDLQWKKITKPQAIVYFNLLQNNIVDIAQNEISIILDALDYKIEEVRLNALKLLNNLLPLSTIKEKSVVTILGKFTSLSLSDISHRLDNLSISYQTKITSKTSHIILCNEPNLQNKTLDLTTKTVSTENNFLTWLNTADEQFLGKKTEENTDALENVSSMLLGDDPEHVELALQMMKTHGVSKELLTDIFIFFNLRQKNKTHLRRAKSLFKKYAPQELLTFLDENKSQYGSMQINSSNMNFYNFLLKNPCINRERIAFYLNKKIFYDFAEDSKQKKEALAKLITNEILDISKLDHIPEEIQKVKGFKVLVCKRGPLYLNHLPEWLGNLSIERLDLYKQETDLPMSFVNFKKLTHLCLPTYLDYFPEVVTKIPSLEVLEMSISQFKKVPEEIKLLTNLKKIFVYREWKDQFNSIQKEKAHLFPKGCIVSREDRR